MTKKEIFTKIKDLAEQITIAHSQLSYIDIDNFNDLVGEYSFGNSASVAIRKAASKELELLDE